MKEFVPGDHIEVERFSDYYRKGLPYLDSVYFKIIPNPLQRSQPEEERDRHDLGDDSRDLFPGRNAHGVDAMAVPGGTFNNIIMPSDKPPFNDNRVREALKYTVDRDLMLAAIYGRHGELGNDHPVSSAYQYYTSLPNGPRISRRPKPC